MAGGSVPTKPDSGGFQAGTSAVSGVAPAALKAAADAVQAAARKLAEAGAFAIRAGSDFEAGMSHVEAVSSASESELAALSAKAAELGETTRFSAAQAAQAFGKLAEAGWSAGDMLDGIGSFARLAAASGGDLASVSQTAARGLAAFGLGARDAARFADVLAKASAVSGSGVDRLGAAFRQAAPLAGTMGLRLEDTAAALALMARAGIEGEQAGASLLSLLTRLADPPREAAAAMDALNLSAVNADGSMRPLGEVVESLREKFAGLDGSQRASAAASIAGNEALSAFLAIVSASPAEFDTLTAALRQADGAAEELAGLNTDNLQGRIAELTASVEGFGAAVYASWQEPLREAAEKGAASLNGLASAFREGGFAGMGGELGNVFSSLAADIAAAAPEITASAASLITSFAQGVTKNSGQIGESAASVVEALVLGVLDVLPETVRAGGELAASLGSGMAEKLPTLLPEMTAGMMDLLDSLAGDTGGMLDTAAQIITGLADGLVESMPVMAERMPEIIEKLVMAVAENAPQLIGAAALLIAALVQGLIENLPAFLENAGQLPGLLVQAFSEYAPRMMEVWEEFLDTTGISEVWQNVQQAFSDGWDAVALFFTDTLPSFFTGLWEDISQAFSDGWDGIAAFFTETIPGWIDSVVAWFQDLPHQLGLIVGEMVGNVLKFGTDIQEWVTVELPLIIQGIVDWFRSLPENIQQWLSGVIDNIKAWGSDMLRKAEETGRDFVDKIVSFVKSIPEKVKEWFDNTIQTVKNWAQEFIDTAKTEIPKFVSNVVDEVGKLPGKIFDIGKNIVSGLWDGIKSMGSWFSDNIGGFWDGLVEGAKNVLDIHSPSGVFRDQIGRMIPLGAEAGIASAFPHLEKSLRGRLSGLTASMQAAVGLEQARFAAAPAAVSGYSAAREGSRTEDNRKTEINVQVEWTGPESGADAKRFGQELGRELENEMRRRGLAVL